MKDEGLPYLGITIHSQASISIVVGILPCTMYDASIYFRQSTSRIINTLRSQLLVQNIANRCHLLRTDLA